MQTFRELRERDCYYVDKTAYIERLLDGGKHYFLSRPRRFGKSLFLDTLKELFEGNQALFEGLYIHDRHDWAQRHPVVRLDFARGHFVEPGSLHANVSAQLDGMEVQAGVRPRYETPPERFGYLISSLHERSGQRVVVLVDEYDKPVLDALEQREIARANRDYLRGLYGVIKASDAHLRFTLLTGVSKFSKVSVFSVLNNLTDLTLDRRYSAICGYTERDLDTVFAPELAGLDREQVREWYNGYRWRGEEKVYNPYDVLLLFDSREFEAHWFETGTPAFLVDTLFSRRVASVSLDRTVSTADLLSAFDVDHIGTEALLFQTGYLTITREEKLGGMPLYRLGYPNREVRQSLNPGSVAPPGAGRRTAGAEQHPPGASAGDRRLRRSARSVPRLLRRHPVREACRRRLLADQQRYREVRGLLRERVLLLLRGARIRDHRGGVQQPRPAGHGGAHRRARLSVRAQGGGDGAAGLGARATTRAALRGQVSRPRGADPPDRG